MLNLKLILISLAFLIYSVYTASFKIDPKTLGYTDKEGRFRIFHGVNVVYKLAPFYPPNLDTFDFERSLSTKDWENMVSWGFKVIRLHIAWEGVEPNRGEYNTTYIEVVRNITRAAAKYDIYVVLDAHQDIANRQFCGEGFPDWAVSSKTFPFPFPFWLSNGEDGYPKPEDCIKHNFALYMNTFDAMNTYKRLYTNEDDLAVSFGNFWALVATYFKDEPNVLGYELMNEPGNAAYYYFLHGIAQDLEYLNKFYATIHPIIRKADNDTIILFETTFSEPNQQMIEALGGDDYKDRQVYSYHHYCIAHLDNGEPEHDIDCAAFDTYDVLFKGNSAKGFGIGGFMTEFGALEGTPMGVMALGRMLSNTDKLLHSWAYWQYKFYDDFTTAAVPPYIESFYNNKGELYKGKVKALARSYAYAICGKPVEMTFDQENATFVLEYNYTKDCSGKGTEVYLSKEFYYPEGISVKFDKGCDGKGCSLSLLGKDENYYGVNISGDVADGATIKFTVSPKVKVQCDNALTANTKCDKLL